jgi:hypothetical protein
MAPQLIGIAGNGIGKEARAWLLAARTRERETGERRPVHGFCGRMIGGKSFMGIGRKTV